MFTLPQSDWSIKTTPDRGRGVFAEKDLPAGTVIGDYLGKIIGMDEEDDSEGIYSMDYRENACIMPDPKEIGVHLINHSCMPNCIMYPFGGHVLIVTSRLVFAGEELNYMYYISPYPKKVGPIHPCYCQTQFCHSTMYSNEEKTRQQRSLMRKLDPLLLGSVEESEFGKEIKLLEKYPEAIPDVPFYDIYGTLKMEPHEVSDDVSLKVSDVRKLIRKTGKCLHFSKLQIIAVGVMDHSVVTIENSEWGTLVHYPSEQLS